MSRMDYHDFHTLSVDAERVSGLFVWPSVTKSGLTRKFFECCKQANDHPNKLVVLEVEFYCYDPEKVFNG